MAGVRTGLLLGAGLMAWLLGPGPLSPYRRALLDRSPPQLVLVLGGDVDRERMGARLAPVSYTHLTLPTKRIV